MRWLRTVGLLRFGISRHLSMADPAIAVGLLFNAKRSAETSELPGLLAKCSGIRLVANVGVSWNRSDQGRPVIGAEDAAKLQTAEILLCDPILFGRCDLQLPNLRWLHSFWAGVESVTRRSDHFQKPSYILTRNGSAFVQAMANYVLGYILVRERHIMEIRQNQAAKVWQQLQYRDMSTITLGILGVGEIGKEIARLSKAVSVNVCGLVRSLPSSSARCAHVDEYYTVENLPELLSKCDYICSVLPSTPDTDGLLDADVLSHCKTKSVLINIGRGNVVKNETVLNALQQGWISHAILDVFETEPLPADSPLWTHPQVTVTPHVAGIGFDAVKFVDDFIVNFEHYKKSEPMNYVVDWSAGY